MKLKEYEAKILLEKAGIPISKGVLIHDVSEINPFSKEKVLKVQTVSKQMGKAGGIITVKNEKEAKETALKFLNKEFQGQLVNELLIDDKLGFKKELYYGITFDTGKRCPVVIFSEEGGVDIESVKADKITKVYINYLTADLNPFFESIKVSEQLKEIFSKLYKCFVKYDCKMVEINPLVTTLNGELVAVDASIVLDDNADYRRGLKFPER